MQIFRTCTVILVLLFLSPQLRAQEPSEALDNSWVTVCAQAIPGTAFFARCQEILNAGPGSGDRRSAAAVGNNLDTIAAQGRTANRISESQEKPIGNIDYEENFGRWSIHFNGSARQIERDASIFENGYDSDQYHLNGGFDYRFADAWTIGALAAYQNANTDFDLNAGQLDISGWSFLGILNGAIGANGYFNAYAGASTLDYETRRNISYSLVLNAGQPNQTTATVSAIATGDTDGDQLLAGAAIGYGWQHSAWQYGIAFNVDLVDTDIDGYTEQGGNGLAQVYTDQNVQSVTAGVTGDLSYTSLQDWGVLMPYARIKFLHEFDNDARSLASRFAGDPSGFLIRYDTQSPDRNFATGALGVSALLGGGTAWYLEAERLFMHDFLSEWAVNAGLRLEF